MASRLEEIRNEKIKKLEALQKERYNPYEIEKFDKQFSTEQLRTKYNSIAQDTESKETVKTAGRVLSIRGHGKLYFLDLSDETGKIQVILRGDKTNHFDDYKYLGIGDFIGVTGTITKTNSGELSINTQDFLILSKNIMPLPDKWHGLEDAEIKYRKRYIDLAIDKTVRDKLFAKFKMIENIRKHLASKGFLEVETPVLHSLLSGASAKPFVTHHNALDIDMFLRIAPECYLKRLIVGGFEKVYEIGRNFRNEGIDFKHNPEFTMMELYWAYADYEDIMNLTEEIITEAFKQTTGKETLVYEGKEISLKRPWKRISMYQSVKDKTGYDFNKISEQEALDIAKKEAIEIEFDSSKGKILSLLFEKHVEHDLIQPTFVTQHPIEISPLAKINYKDQRYTQRFELFINTWEIANAFSELNDPFDQYNRLKKQVELKELGDEEANDMDYDFVEALETGLPPTGGLGIGIDRLAMLITDSHSIRDILAFPLLRPDKGTLQVLFETLDPSLKKEVEPKNKTEKKSEKKALPITREKAWEFILKHNSEKYDLNHYLESEAVMKAVAKKLNEDEEYYGMLGLLHDIDWGETKSDSTKHLTLAPKLLKELNLNDEFISVILSHGYGYDCADLKDKKRTKKIEYALACSETITGLIHSYYLMRKSFDGMKAKGLMEKFKDGKFAAKIDRNAIKECELIGIPLDQFMQLAIDAIAEIKDKLNF